MDPFQGVVTDPSKFSRESALKEEQNGSVCHDSRKFVDESSTFLPTNFIAAELFVQCRWNGCAGAPLLNRFYIVSQPFGRNGYEAVICD